MKKPLKKSLNNFHKGTVQHNDQSAICWNPVSGQSCQAGAWNST